MGQLPVVQIIEGKKNPEDLCEAAKPGYLGFARAWIRFCDAAATETWQYGCLHEHVKVRRSCAEHRPEPGAVGCIECFEQGHECAMVAKAGRFLASAAAPA